MPAYLIALALLIPPVATPVSQEPSRPPERGQQRQGPKPYEEVVTKEAKTQDGIFKVHQVGDKLLFEIPKEQLGKPFLWTTEVKMTPTGGYGGTSAGDRVVIWTRRDDRVLLRIQNYTIRAEKGDEIRLGVEAASVQPIAQVFDVQAYSADGSCVIDVTRFFTSDPPEFSVRSVLGVGSVDVNRSFLDRVKAFESNVNVQVTLTFGQGQAPTTPGPGGPFGPRGAGQPSNTAVVLYSIVRLPDEPMMGRLFDSRVGYFSVSFTDYGTDEHRAARRRFITRYRLEKKHPDATISEPVQPIVYYLSREVPEKWRPYIKKGIEDWQVAFEQAGFRNAIIAMDAPDDPDWDPEDARYSVIRWAPTPTENAMGPHVHDPRSGEIISAHIIIWHNILNLLTTWYFVQASPCDPRAQKLPFPDELMGELVRYVTAHEVGHTLGLQHNFKATSSYTVANLRSKEFTEKYGTEASIMDYGRFNYVAQPGDGARLIPMVGPYDKFAIEWGYKPIPGATNTADEKRTLDEIAARQVDDPMLRFGSNPNEDPTEQSEDLSSDAVEATRLGIRNLERVAGYVLSATSKFGEDYSELNERYASIWGQYSTEINHVIPLVGGSVMVDYHAGRGGDVFTPVPADRQRAAVRLIIEECFNTPKGLIRPEVISKIQPTGVASRVSGIQSGVLNRLLSSARLTRMLEDEVRYTNVYGVDELLADLRAGIFSELTMSSVSADVYRRNLQRTYVVLLISKLEERTTGIRALALGELQVLSGMLSSAVPIAADRQTRLHLQDLASLVGDAITPRR